MGTSDQIFNIRNQPHDEKSKRITVNISLHLVFTVNKRSNGSCLTLNTLECIEVDGSQWDSSVNTQYFGVYWSGWESVGQQCQHSVLWSVLNWMGVNGTAVSTLNTLEYIEVDGSQWDSSVNTQYIGVYWIGWESMGQQCQHSIHWSVLNWMGVNGTAVSTLNTLECIEVDGSQWDSSVTIKKTIYSYQKAAVRTRDELTYGNTIHNTIQYLQIFTRTCTDFI